MSAGSDGVRLGARLFTFAVIADTHVNQEEGKASSDFAVNRLANARVRHVMHELRHAAPAFVLHLGDIVHPTPGHPAYAQAAAAFHELARILDCPLHLTPGNHDVGDKPGDWLPVPSVNDDYLALYRKHFGAHYHSFDARGCHFVIIDAQVVNSGLESEARQRRWLEEDLARNAGRRTFLCTHYPFFLFDPAEEGHYDNIDEPGRSWLLDLCARRRVEAVFAGHVHNFWYHEVGATQMYLLPSPAFVRLDYSEMFRIEAAPERGRNDAGKLGYLLVDVHERGHVAHAIRTFGVERGADAPVPAPTGKRVPHVHTRSIVRPVLGIDLRYPWAEAVDVPASGAIDEFARKRVRNDYPLLALWEMGVRRLRVPTADLVEAPARARMGALRRMGHELTVATHGLRDDVVRALRDHRDLVTAVEVIAAARDFPSLARPLAAVRDAGVAVVLSCLQRHDSSYHHGNRARHVIQHGFDVGQAPHVARMLAAAGLARLVDGVVFRLDRGADIAASVAAIAAFGIEHGVAPHAYVRLASDVPSVAEENDLANANRVAEAMLLALAHPGVRLTLDTLNDVDRGYFPRTGLLDRRYNPRLAGDVVRHLHGVFGRDAAPLALRDAREHEGCRVLVLTGERDEWIAVLPGSRHAPATLPWGDARAACQSIDLGTGIVTDALARDTIRGNATPRGELAAPAPGERTSPRLLRLSRAPP